MARIRPDWTPDQVGNAGLFAFGFAWSSDIPVQADGLWWYQPDHEDAPAAVTAVLYDTATEAELASGVSGALVIGWNLVPFAAPYAASAATSYTSAVESTGAMGYGLDQLTAPITDPTGHVTIPTGGGRYQDGGGYPASTWSGQHGVDLEFSTEVAPSEGAAALDLDLAVAATGARDSAGTAALGLQLDVAAAGARDSAGTATVGLDLAVAAAGTRDSLGAADVGIVFTIEAVGARPSVGTAALELHLAVAAEGPGSGGVSRPSATPVARPSAVAVGRPSTAAVPRPSL
jgi:hypothetical protein